MSKPKLITILVILTIFGIILLQNAEDTSLKLLFWDISMSRIFFFPFLFCSGVVVGFIVANIFRSSSRRRR
ncbi:MAG: hypothetical protein PHU03_04330 [Syntrophales bacterium]|nr:hypothetical protein [Syntrophales bacterium]